MGSLQYKDQSHNQRRHFPGVPYIGCDLEPGNGVDRIEDVTRMTFKDGEVGTLLALNLLEHVGEVFKACSEITRVVKPGGAAIIVCPFALHIHPYPKDFWRFTHDSMQLLLKGFPWLIVGRRGYETFPRTVFAVGFKTEAFPEFDRRLESFREMLLREGREDASLLTHLRVRLGAAIGRKKYFREFFGRNDLTLDIVKPAGS